MSSPRVVVAALERDSIARRALDAEGVPHSEWLCLGHLDYAALLTSSWSYGGFVVVEHDIAPWVGAIQELWDCPNDWCMFRYPKAGQLTRGLGCTKFSARLTAAYPNLPDTWQGVDWHYLDGVVGRAVARVLGRKPCYHGPPVAHVRQWP